MHLLSLFSVLATVFSIIHAQFDGSDAYALARQARRRALPAYATARQYRRSLLDDELMLRHARRGTAATRESIEPYSRRSPVSDSDYLRLRRRALYNHLRHLRRADMAKSETPKTADAAGGSRSEAKSGSHQGTSSSGYVLEAQDLFLKDAIVDTLPPLRQLRPDVASIESNLKALEAHLTGTKILVLLPTDNKDKVKSLKQFVPSEEKGVVFEVFKAESDVGEQPYNGAGESNFTDTSPARARADLLQVRRVQ